MQSNPEEVIKTLQLHWMASVCLPNYPHSPSTKKSLAINLKTLLLTKLKCNVSYLKQEESCLIKIPKAKPC